MLRVRFIRCTRGLEQRAVARSVGLNSGVLSELETGRRNPTPDQLRRLSKFYKLAPELLFQHVVDPLASEMVSR